MNRSGVVLGFDFGTRRIGVAVGNALLKTARAITTVNADRDPWPALTQLIQEWKPDALVVGQPLDSDGGDQPVLQRSHQFCSALTRRFGLPVYRTDERFTTLAAQSELKSRRSQGQRQKPQYGERDAEAARLILEDWLNQQSGTPDAPTPA